MAITVSTLTPANYKRGITTSATITGLLFNTLSGTPNVYITTATDGRDLVAENVVVVDATHITCDFFVAGECLKDAAQTSDLYIDDGGAPDSLANCARVIANPPTISDTVTPSSGTPSGGASLAITGTGLDIPGLAIEAPTGSSCTSPTADSATAAHGTTPAHAAGAVKVKVTTEDGSAETTVDAYTYTAAGRAHRYDSHVL